MYSPKISEDLIPVLYRIGKAQKIAMTKLVDQLLRPKVQELEAGLPSTNPERS